MNAMKFNSTYFIYPGGMIMPGRFSTSGDYRYGYNGMEMDNETSGNGNSYTTEFRQYDPRLMRWKSLDPLMAMFPWMSPYVAFDNNPIVYTDPYGLAAGTGDGDPPGKEGDPEEFNPNEGSEMYDNSQNELVNQSWETTKSTTKRYKGVGGMIVNVPNRSKPDYFKDDNGDGIIGYNGVEYEGVRKGQLRSFRGHDEFVYSAKFSKGKFLGYQNEYGTTYDNQEVKENDIFEEKLKQGLEYMANYSSYKRSGFKAPRLHYKDHFHLNSFTLDGITFNGQVDFVNQTWLTKDIQFEQRFDYMYFFTSGINIAGKTLPEGFVVSFWTNYPGAYPYDALVVVTFSNVYEWKKFVQYLVNNYGLNDQIPLTSKSLTPSQVLKF